MPKCTNCGAYTVHKNTLCESCAALQGSAQTQEQNFGYNPAAQSSVDSSYSSQQTIPEPSPFETPVPPVNNYTPTPPVNSQGYAPIPNQQQQGYAPMPGQQQAYPQSQRNYSPFDETRGTTDISSQTRLEERPGVYSGIVAHINKFSPKRNRKGRVSFLGRWTKSFFTGEPFSMRPTSCTFQLQLSARVRNDLQGISDAVTIHTFMDEHDYATDFAPGNRLRVYGRRGPHNYIYANAVENLSTGTRLSGLGGVSCWVVRIVTVLLIAALFSLTSMPISFSGMPNWGTLSDSITYFISLIIIALIFLAVIRQSPKLRKYALWIGITIVLGLLLGEQFAVIAILIGGILMMLGYFR